MADLSALVVRLLDRCNAEGGAHIKGIAADAWEVFRAHAWPGNLRNSTPSSPPRAPSAHRPYHRRRPTRVASPRPAHGRDARSNASVPLPLDALLEEAERRLMELAIRPRRRQEDARRRSPVDPASAYMAPN